MEYCCLCSVTKVVECNFAPALVCTLLNTPTWLAYLLCLVDHLTLSNLMLWEKMHKTVHLKSRRANPPSLPPSFPSFSSVFEGGIKTALM